MIILKPLAYGMISLIEVMLKIVGFLAGGAYMRGSVWTKFEIIEIEPWPTFYGRRFPPFVIFVVAAAGILYQYVGIAEAGLFVAHAVFIALVFYYIDPNEKSAAQHFAETAGPVIDQKLKLAYYREPRFFPAIHLVD